jgi:carboxymethylenebutenolidase
MQELNRFQRYLVHEFVEDYQDGLMSRRDMMSRVLHITGGVAAAATMLTKLGVDAAGATAQGQPMPTPTEPRSPLTVPEDDPTVAAQMISFEGNGAELMVYQALPNFGATPVAPITATPVATPAATPLAGPSGPPLILVCHENRGLTDHIRDVTRRLARTGYAAVALDLLSREGGTANVPDPSQIPDILSREDPARHVADFQAVVTFYSGQTDLDVTRLGMTGFCFGGGITWAAATQMPELKAAVPWYGPPPPTDQVANIEAAVLGIYSSDPDDFANEGREELEAALEEAGVTFKINVYPDTQHAFHNDTGPRYNEVQAVAAWTDALDWLGRHL